MICRYQPIDVSSVDWKQSRIMSRHTKHLWVCLTAVVLSQYVYSWKESHCVNTSLLVRKFVVTVGSLQYLLFYISLEFLSDFFVIGTIPNLNW